MKHKYSTVGLSNKHSKAKGQRSRSYKVNIAARQYVPSGLIIPERRDTESSNVVRKLYSQRQMTNS